MTLTTRQPSLTKLETLDDLIAAVRELRESMKLANTNQQFFPTLHPDTFHKSFTIRADQRLILAGPIATPPGVVIDVEPGGVLLIL